MMSAAWARRRSMFSSESTVLAFIFCLGILRWPTRHPPRATDHDSLLVDTSTRPQNVKDRCLREVREHSRCPCSSYPAGDHPVSNLSIAVIADNFERTRIENRKFRRVITRPTLVPGLRVTIRFCVPATCQALVAAWEHPAVQARVRSFRPCGLLAHRTHQRHG
jgi:hypothetical protein